MAVGGGDSEPVTVVCADWPDPEERITWTLVQAPGTVRRTCETCGRGISVSPAGTQLKREEGARLLCYGCATEEAPDKHPEIHPIVKAHLLSIGFSERWIDEQAANLSRFPLAEQDDRRFR